MVDSPTAESDSPEAEPFWWGTTSSSVSAEGVADTADWWAWEKEGRAPRSYDGAGIGTDFRDDFALLATLGLSHIRITIEWARLEPAEGKRNSDAVDRYRDMLAAARDSGLIPWVTMQHGTLPGWYLDDEGGHRDNKSRGRYWSRHVDFVAETFDDLAEGWTPIEDPISWAIRGYGLGTRPPGRTGNPSALAEAIEGAMLAVDEGVRLLRSGRQTVMATFRADPIHARPEEDRRIAPETASAVREWDGLMWGTWLQAVSDGTIRVGDRFAKNVENLVTGVDVVGLIHDHPVGVDHFGNLVSWPAAAPTDISGFAPEPAELGEAIHRAHEALPSHKLAVASHGIATLDDNWRGDVIDAAVGIVTEAQRDFGLLGYFHETAIDGYEWAFGFDGPRGLINRDRRPKDSVQRLPTV